MKRHQNTLNTTLLKRPKTALDTARAQRVVFRDAQVAQHSALQARVDLAALQRRHHHTHLALPVPGLLLRVADDVVQRAHHRTHDEYGHLPRVQEHIAR